LPARGGRAVQSGRAWQVKWLDGSESAQICFDARTAEQNPELEWITLEDSRARAVISELPYCVSGQPLPIVKIAGLPKTVSGVWSLWELRLVAEGFNRRRFLPVFAMDDGRTFVPTAKRVWDLLLTEDIHLAGSVGAEAAARHFDSSQAAATSHGDRLFAELSEEHRTWLKGERERSQYAYDARRQAIGRIGLPAVRQHRRKRLDAEYQARMDELGRAEATMPDLNAVVLLRIE
jgi:hypothetical protein